MIRPLWLLFLVGWMGSSPGMAQSQTPPSPLEIPLWQGPVPGFGPNFKHQAPVDMGQGHISETSRAFIRVFDAAPDKASGHAVLIFPGGGYSLLSTEREGSQVARYFAERGICAFVVGYRVSKKHHHPGYRFPGPLLDARQAMRHVKQNAKRYKIDPQKVGVIGFSAGGHLASMVATRFSDPLKGDPPSQIDTRPAFAALIYPVISMTAPYAHRGSRFKLLGKNAGNEQCKAASAELRLDSACPPLFLVHNQFDPVASENSLQLALAAKKVKVPCELHLYPTKDHGFGLAKPGNNETNQPAMIWPQLLEKFIQRLP